MCDEKKALKKIMDYLSRRSHSEKELSTKLSKTFSPLVIEKALKKAKQNKWLESPWELAEKTLDSLQKKNKSWAYIQNFLCEKNLPIPPYDHDKELEKAHKLLLKKRASLQGLSYQEKLKLKRFLFYRGFKKSIANELLEE